MECHWLQPLLKHSYFFKLDYKTTKNMPGQTPLANSNNHHTLMDNFLDQRMMKLVSYKPLEI